MKRFKGLATLGTGQIANEKQLASLGDFLSLRERVEFRQRVFACGTLLFFPKWDMDGPDLRFFGDWTTVSKPGCLQVGPWSIDGRQLVADAKDIGVMLAEAASRLHPDTDVKLGIVSPFGTEVVGHRGWSFGRTLFDAFWSGIRKASEVLSMKLPHVQFHAIADVNPFAEFKRQTFVVWTPAASVTDDMLVAVPGDAFSVLGNTDEEAAWIQKRCVDTPSAKLMLGLLTQTVPVHTSVLASQLRTNLWNPKARLQLLNKCKSQTQRPGTIG